MKHLKNISFAYKDKRCIFIISNIFFIFIYNSTPILKMSQPEFNPAEEQITEIQTNEVDRSDQTTKTDPQSTTIQHYGFLEKVKIYMKNIFKAIGRGFKITFKAIKNFFKKKKNNVTLEEQADNDFISK